MTIETPCSLGNPDDWFIEKDGKQYRDDEILTQEEIDLIEFNDDVPMTVEEIDAAIDAAEAEKIKQNLIRRRKARDACYECPIRLACLDARIGSGLEYGTWGGYYTEELKQIEDLQRARLRRREGVQ